MILLCVIYKNLKNTLEVSQFENKLKVWESYGVSFKLNFFWYIWDPEVAKWNTEFLKMVYIWCAFNHIADIYIWFAIPFTIHLSTHSFTLLFHTTRHFTVNFWLLTNTSFHLMKENSLQFMVDPNQSNNFLNRTHAVVLWTQ